MKLIKIIKNRFSTNPYDLLKVSKNDDFRIIKKNYYKLIQKYHPDKNKQKNSIEKF